MTGPQIIELIGYVATALIVISLSMKSIVRLRTINLIGAIIFSVYGGFIQSLPVICLNLTTATLNIFHLFKLQKKKDRFEILEARTIDEPLMQRFINFYREDIVSFFGVPELHRQKEYLVCYILRNMVPAGIFIGEKIHHEESKNISVEILIDYVTPEYRDLKNSKFLFFGNKQWLAKHRIENFFIHTENKKHQDYIKKIGFLKDEAKGADYYSLKNAKSS